MTLDATHACVVDLDGVVWLADEPLPGATEGLALLRSAQIPVLFATNNSAPTHAELAAKLERQGAEVRPGEIVTSADAAALLLAGSTRALVVGEAGLHEALARAGIVVDVDAPEAVVVGLSRAFDYEACDRASAHVRSGARFVATNRDPTLPVPGALRPGAGAIVAAIAVAAGREPEVAGKPSATMARVIQARVVVGAVVGDRATTDGELARRLGAPFALVASGANDGEGAASVRAPSLLEAVRALLG